MDQAPKSGTGEDSRGQSAVRMLRADLHSHTLYSPDCASSLESIVETCQRKGISCLAVTDHNETEGAIRLAGIAPFKVIVGEEIRSTGGEIIGYFLTERVPPRLSARETVERIKLQGGLVGVPHPFDRLRRSRLTPEVLAEVLADVDILEVGNSRIHFVADREVAARFAREHGLTASAGSDGHTVGELGGAYVEMRDFTSPEDFLVSLAQGRVHCRMVNPLIHFTTMWTKYRKKYLARR